MKIINKKARFKYNLLEDYEAGIELLGGEVKSIKNGLVDLDNSYVKFIKDQAYLINANISAAGIKDPTRSRRLLLHKSELVSIQSKIKAKKLTIVPVSMYTKGRLIKTKLSLAKTKRGFEKRETVKKKDIERDIERELKEVTNRN